MTINRASIVSACAMVIALSSVLPSASARDTPPDQATLEQGVIIPAGPPLYPPVRVDAGGSCVIDIVLPYVFTGSLEGAAEIDYRIETKGPCSEATPGKFDETWIARGTFFGSPVDAGFVYLADVKKGGKMRGEIVLGQGLEGRLWVTGNLMTGDHLDYRGFVENP